MQKKRQKMNVESALHRLYRNQNDIQSLFERMSEKHRLQFKL